VQPLNLFECQTSDEIIKHGIGNELIYFDSLPLCFSSFQIVRGNLIHILVKNHSVSHEIPIEPMPQSSKNIYDPIANMMDSLYFQSQFSITLNDFKRCYDMDMIRQSTPMSCSVEVLVQNSSAKIKSCSKSLEYIKNTCVAPDHEVEMIELDYPVMG